MNNLHKKHINLLTYLYLISSAIIYFIIIQILYVYVDVIYDKLSYYSFLVGLGITLIASFFITKNAYYNEEDDRSKTITHLAIAHIPSMLGLTYWVIMAFGTLN